MKTGFDRTTVSRGRGFGFGHDGSGGSLVDSVLTQASHVVSQASKQLGFATREEAEAYARRMGIDYAVAEPQAPALKLRAYADNFRYDRVR